MTIPRSQGPLFFAAGILAVTAGAALAQSASPAGAGQPHARPIIRPYFEPQPDGSLVGRSLTHLVRLNGRGIVLEPGDTAETRRRLVGIEFAGAKRGAKIEGIGEQGGRVNYLLGSDRTKWRTGIPVYDRGRTRELYPGIDVEYYAAERQLEYDFIVRPGADVGRIRLKAGAPLRLTAEGDLSIGTSVTQRRPTAYQRVAGERLPVSARYVVHRDGAVGIALGAYDRKRELVIDPIIVVATTTFDGSGTESASGVTMDEDGFIFVAGTTTSVDLPVQNPFRASNPGGSCSFGGLPTACSDGFLLKLAPDGSTVAFATYFGGSHFDFIEAIALDSTGSIYIAGNSSSPDFPGRVSTCPGSQRCTFVAKLTNDGQSLVYSTMLPFCCGPATKLAVSGEGEAFINKSVPGGWSIQALSPDGQTVRTVYTAPFRAQAVGSIALGPSGDLYVVGSTFDPVTSSGSAPPSGRRDHLIWRVTRDGVREARDAGLQLPGSFSAKIWAHPARPGLLFANHGSALWRSDDSGGSWAHVRDEVPVERLEPDRSNGNVVYAWLAESLLRSVDAGLTWQPVSMPGVSVFAFKVAGATSTAYIQTLAGIFKSVDRGTTWQPLPLLNGYALVAVDGSSPARLYVQPLGGGILLPTSILRTSDDGATLDTVTFPAFGSLQSIDPSVPTTLYATTFFGPDASLSKSTDDGVSWTTIFPGFTGYPILSIHPTASGTLALRFANTLANTLDGALVLRSDDGGMTWATVENKNNVMTLAFDAGDTDSLYLGTQLATDVFLTRVTSAGDPRYTMLLGGSSDDFAHSVSVDASETARISGASQSDDFPYSSPPSGDAAGGPSRVFIARIDSTGALVSAAAFGHSAAINTSLTSRVIGAADAVYVATCASASCEATRFEYGGGQDGPFAVPSAQFAVDSHGRQVFASGATGVQITTYQWGGPPQAHLSVNTTFPVKIGTPITWTTTVTGGIGPFQYQWLLYDQATGWHIVQPYGSNVTFTWTPTFGDIGMRALQVWVRQVGSSNALDTYDGSGYFDVLDNPLTAAVTTSATFPRPAGTPITWTVTTSGGVAPFEYQFWLYNGTLNTWRIIQDFGEANTFVWTPASPGTYGLQVNVRSAGSPQPFDTAVNVYPLTIAPAPPIAVTSVAPDTALTVTAGTPMTWTATATGGSPPLQYRFIVYDQTANAWSELRNYGAENSVIWTPLHSGTYRLQVWVRAPGSTAIFDAWAPSEEVMVVAPPVPTMVALRSDKPLPPAIGTPITWTADAAGDGLDYKFLLYRGATNSWTTMQDYGPSAGWTWAGPSQADIYAISVWVRRHGSLADYETWSGTGYFTVASGPVQNLTLTTNQTFPLAPGSPITWTASASGGTAPLEYQFWLYDRHTSAWTIKQPWSSSATWTWTPTATDYGVHAMQVWVRSQGSAAAFEAYRGSGFFVIIP